MKPVTLSLSPLALAALLSMAAPASAQTAPAPAPAVAPAGASTAKATDAEAKKEEQGTLKLEQIIITGTSTARTKMKQSVSVSTLDGDQIQKLGAASAAEVLRAIPGIRAESSGGEGNANITVRGAPISAGGSRYLQLQEDGLPVILVGDISFATSDQFIRADSMVDTIQAIRGGSASTLATNSPAGIVNFITKTGRNTGGEMGLSVGMDHRQARIDFASGLSLGERTSMAVGGFMRIGEGVRPSNVTLEDGGQVRLNLTHTFSGGYLRLNFKHLDDKTPTYLPVPVQLNGNRIQAFGSVDPRTAFFINSNLAQDTTYDRSGNAVVSNPADGLHVKTTSFGLEFEADVGNGFKLQQRLRKSAISGRFIGAFPAGAAASDAGNGADRYTGTTPVFSMHMFNTSLDDMGNLFSDTRLARTFDLGSGSKLTTTGGLFFGKQAIAETWYWNRYNIGLTGEGAGVYNNAGGASTVPVGNGTTTWGGCCVRAIDVDITAVAPYAALTYDAGPLSVDASLRNDRQRTNGWQMFDNTPGTGGAFAGWDQAGRTNVAYSASSTSYSFGANWEFSRALAAFGRYSKGSAWASPDRTIWDAAVAGGSQPYPINEIKQLEVGVKMRQGAFNGFFTLFNANTREDGAFEVGSQVYRKDSYKATGIEAEVAWRSGPFSLAGGGTWTNAKLTTPGATQGNKPRRQADFVYQVTPSYSMGSLDVGMAIVGTTKSYAQNDNQVELPAYMVINPFLSYQVSDKLQFGLTVNNLLNKVGYTEAEGQGNLTNNPLYVARSINGRSVKASLKYSF